MGKKGVILETEGSYPEDTKRALFYFKKVKKATPNLTSPYVQNHFTIVLIKPIFEKKVIKGSIRTQFKSKITPEGGIFTDLKCSSNSSWPFNKVIHKVAKQTSSFYIFIWLIDFVIRISKMCQIDNKQYLHNKIFEGNFWR